MSTQTTKTMGRTIIGKTTGHRRGRTECWQVTTAEWSAEREESPGTPWRLTHLPTDWTLITIFSSVDDALDEAADGSAYVHLWHDAHRVLDLPDTGGHDHARAVLTWIVEHRPRTVHLVELAALEIWVRDTVRRLGDVHRDLEDRLDAVMRDRDDPAAGFEAARLRGLARQVEDEATWLRTNGAEVTERLQEQRRAAKDDHT